ncbi:NAD(P)-dependent dehydrogenase, short-chain alcohol dehydrogenase family [Pricia antarctica]|uniref:NAD(P)-dependent dehydrogenase, short-chain alcohol dehydrogenase family n=1 Tax=Pricia antarctica TaxID=641691 RepID=A0A1G7FR64_9FLAO|nr:SDR family oxidoreductase [Pricia antarctica]SDE78403.1 NAD(P)-dependent dehydrogenase, short-chain alcohol dehydrogenase family [Pricia antarctica]
MKTVLITGTSKGIGLETALAFGRAGYKVFATMRNPEKASFFKQQITSEALDITISKMDVDIDASVKHCMDDIIKKNGSIDILVNNAGIERHGSIEEMSMNDFQSVMNTNYFGVLRCTKALLPHMRKNKKGRIINVASVSGHISNSPLGAYSASKHALEAVSEALAQEVKPFNVRVAIVEPGIISTQMANDISLDGSSIYPNSKRFGGLFAASLEIPTPPSLVASKIFEIAESDTWKLRHPVGPDAEPFLQWRASLTDEEYVDWNAASDDDWYESVESAFGLNARTALGTNTSN